MLWCLGIVPEPCPREGPEDSPQATWRCPTPSSEAQTPIVHIDRLGCTLAQLVLWAGAVVPWGSAVVPWGNSGAVVPWGSAVVLWGTLLPHPRAWSWRQKNFKVQLREMVRRAISGPAEIVPDPRGGCRVPALLLPGLCKDLVISSKIIYLEGHKFLGRHGDLRQF